jgi:hypothetical protein
MSMWTTISKFRAIDFLRINESHAGYIEMNFALMEAIL